MSYVKGFAKWAGIAIGAYIAALFLNDVSLETKIFFIFFGLCMAISYIDGSHKDRIADLEHKIDRLNRQINGDY